jgi:glycine cleavage system transcriptional repressor
MTAGFLGFAKEEGKEMKRYAIITSVGADRAGIVHDISQLIFDHNCNVEDSRMAVLGGQFALMSLFSGQEVDLQKLRQELGAFEDQSGLKVMLADAVGPHEYARPPTLPVRLEVVAMDAPGILAQLTEVLGKHKVNIETLDAHLAPAPTSGTTVSSVKMKIGVPQDVSIQSVKDALMELAVHMNLDLIFQPVQE